MIDCSDEVFAQRCADDVPGYRELLVTRYQSHLKSVVTAVFKRQANGRHAPLAPEDLTQEVFADLLDKSAAKLRTFKT